MHKDLRNLFSYRSQFIDIDPIAYINFLITLYNGLPPSLNNRPLATQFNENGFPIMFIDYIERLNYYHENDGEQLIKTHTISPFIVAANLMMIYFLKSGERVGRSGIEDLHKLFGTAFYCGIKIIYDITFEDWYYARLFGVELAELIYLEQFFLKKIEFDIGFSKNKFDILSKKYLTIRNFLYPFIPQQPAAHLNRRQEQEERPPGVPPKGAI